MSVATTIGELREWLRFRKVKRYFLVADQTAFHASGVAAAFDEQLPTMAAGVFDGFDPNPKWEDAVRGARRLVGCQWDAMVAVGGGTAIDLAKLMRCLVRHDNTVSEGFEDVQAIEPSCLVSGPDPRPFVAIPTTAGSGSHATHFAVVYKDKVKYSVTHKRLLPELSVLDWQFTVSMPRTVTAATGLDALCQAVEAIWSVNATRQSTDWASLALRLANEHLVAAVQRPTPAARQAMLEASDLAGRAINVTRTTAPHALSYALTSDYGIPHGFAVAVFLPKFLIFNAEVTDDDCAHPAGVGGVRKAIAEIVRCLGANTVAEAAERLHDIIQAVGGYTDLQSCSVGLPSIDALLRRANPDRMQNNPRRVTTAGENGAPQ
ncbi:MAG: phosphonoacetaldehyde reductase [Pirellulaceae bacterium]|nr:phosphonoacetaldehyde reductase [Planctomycetales bacterium]